ncbi:SpoIIE family protein phosphatase [Streptomyces sp. 3MP-14]|uniref:SpoIIE family protein phosphatase n=1 Tax=Streptomyces mimosae TaxID=2586635 RepID=A0A5N5ZZN9_9ACTN|nr:MULTISPECIES: SpoIIE family protein phosphatase [Streptomyces]KAB8161957.1 SpoIIE family protein phosphatase [Streptomyces mimosae]KAB8173655.1 SpoIIE family protein phosphatase [Streptomyces sp. 3MP-14]
MLSSQNPQPPIKPPVAQAAHAGPTLDELIARARRLREDLDAARRADPRATAGEPVRRAAWELVGSWLDDVGEQLHELRTAPGPPAPASSAPRVGSAEWNLLTDGAIWSDELYAIFGRPQREGPLTLDQLPSFLPAEDQPALTAAVTGCLVDGRPMDCEFRITRPDGTLRTVRMAGEPVLDDDGGTVALWAMIRDVDEVRHPVPSQRGPGARGRRGGVAGREVERALAEEAHGAPSTGPGGLEVAARYVPAGRSAPLTGKWCDALELPGGASLLSVGDLAGRGPAAVAGTATALGAIRGIALAGQSPAALLGHLNQLLDRGAHPVLASVLCCRFEPADRSLVWAQAGHPAPLLCRDGTGWALPRPTGTLLGAVGDTAYAERTDPLRPGDVLVLHTDGLFSDIPERGVTGHAGDHRLIDLAGRLSAAGSAAECLRLIVEERAEHDRHDDACVLVARVGR